MALKELVSNETTEFGLYFDDWRKAISYAGELLEKTDCIEHTYTQHMVELVEQMGPYIVVMPGVALAHARPQGDVLKNSVAIVTMTKGVSFGNDSNDPVYILFAIAAITDEAHLKLFRDVAKFIAEEENVRILRNATRFEQIPI